MQRQGQEAQWERLDAACVPDNMLSTFVQQTHATKAVPIPGQSLTVYLIDF